VYKLIETKGEDKPGALAHHTSVVYGDKMYLFGGSNLEKENRKFYTLDLSTYKWEVVKSRGDLPITRDEHTAVLNENEGSMIIFGGFSDGSRTNELIKYTF
jgi:N-acetylneuraminic acid mutarotase